MLIAEQAGQRIEGRKAERGGDFACPRCKETVILKRGRIVIEHFAHKPPIDCSWARGETLQHMGAKQIVRDAFVGRGLKAEQEYVINAQHGDRRADVVVWAPNGRMVAIELQHTSIDLGEIEARARAYAREEMAQIWIPFIPASVWVEAVVQPGDQYLIEKYSVRPFEKWVHGFHLKDGMWMYDPRDGSFWHAKMDKHNLYVEESHWYSDSGEEMTAGGYYYPSKRYRELTLKGPFSIEDLLMKYKRRRARACRHLGIPSRRKVRFIGGQRIRS